MVRLLTVAGDEMSSGSAFAVSNEGHYVTNYHVIEAALQGALLVAVESVSPAKKLHDAEVIWHSQQQDLAIVHVPGWRRMPLVLAGDIKKGRGVKSIGFPGNVDFDSQNPSFTEPKLTPGEISAPVSVPLQASSGPVDIYVHTATINSGNSGGPLL